MRRLVTPLAVLILAAVGLGAPPRTAALDLTGTWNGRVVCKGLDAAGEKDRLVLDGVLQIQQTGNTFNLAANGEFFAGEVLASASDPDRGVTTFIDCGTTAALPSSSQMVLAKVSVDPGTGAGTLTGHGPYVVDGAQYACTWAYRRTGPLFVTFGCSP
jgi:hypothetical protein